MIEKAEPRDRRHPASDRWQIAASANPPQPAMSHDSPRNGTKKAVQPAKAGQTA
jgi:hypothetical protein